MMLPFWRYDKRATGLSRGICLVVMIHSLPKERTLVLKENLIGKIVSILSGFLIRPPSEAATPSQIFPLWLPSSLLLLELMAQPFVAFPSKGDSEDNASQSIEGGSELEEVKDEHAKRVLDFSCFANAIFLALIKTATKSPHETKPTKEEKGGANSN
jgi:hypothetical protein